MLSLYNAGKTLKSCGQPLACLKLISADYETFAMWSFVQNSGCFDNY